MSTKTGPPWSSDGNLNVDRQLSVVQNLNIRYVDLLTILLMEFVFCGRQKSVGYVEMVSEGNYNGQRTFTGHGQTSSFLMKAIM